MTGAAIRFTTGALFRPILDRPSVRFLLAGGLATAVNASSRVALSLMFRFEIAVASAYALGMVVGFLAYRNWVFRGSHVRLPHQVLRFSLVNTAGLVVVVSVASGVLPFLSATPFLPHRSAEALAHVSALVVASVVNFVGHRSLSFARGPSVDALATRA